MAREPVPDHASALRAECAEVQKPRLMFGPFMLMPGPKGHLEEGQFGTVLIRVGDTVSPSHIGTIHSMSERCAADANEEIDRLATENGKLRRALDALAAACEKTLTTDDYSDDARTMPLGDALVYLGNLDDDPYHTFLADAGKELNAALASAAAELGVGEKARETTKEGTQ